MVRTEENVYKIKRIVQRKIESLCEENPWSRAMLAKLRRGVGKPPGELPELFEILLEGLPEEFYSLAGKPSYSVWAVYTALTLFAVHQQGKDKPMSYSGNEDGERGNSLGSATARLVQIDREREPAVKRRFDAVITANGFIELAHHARGLIQLLKAENVTLDYPQLAADLFRYQFDDAKDRIRLRWGEDYYRVLNFNKKKENGGNNDE